MPIKRYLLEELVAHVPKKEISLIVGARQVGKTTLSRHLMGAFSGAQYLNWNVLADRAVLQRQSWNPRAKLLVIDEIHKMRGWTADAPDRMQVG